MGRKQNGKQQKLENGEVFCWVVVVVLNNMLPKRQ